MRWEGRRESSNVEDRRGSPEIPLGGEGRFSLASLPISNRAKFFVFIAVVIVALISGADPLKWLSGDFSPSQTRIEQSAQSPEDDQAKRFVATILGDTEDVWASVFEANGKSYPPTTLVLFRDGTRSGCGFAQSATGPFYCPVDGKVYIDLGFFNMMEKRMGVSGDFAEAYVIAHEVGHHIQHLLGQLNSGDGQQRGSEGMSVRTELQADCYAGIWAYHTDRIQHILEPGDIDEALNAASAVGDDRLQKSQQGHVVPDSFTHGTSTQRQRWFKRGYESGQLSACDTFRAKAL